MPLFLETGSLNLNSYIACYTKYQLPLNEKKIVLIFPGNASHHRPDVTLFTIKRGSGLAALAHNLGEAGYPCLSLPTTDMENWANNDQIKQTVNNALGDIYAAAKQGYSFILPVRQFQNHFFSQALDTTAATQLEPSFWGLTNQNVNKPLADYYTQELKRLMAFLNLSEEARLNETNNPFLSRYLNADKQPSPPIAAQGLFSAHRPQPHRFNPTAAIGLVSTAIFIFALVTSQPLVLALAIAGWMIALGLRNYSCHSPFPN